MASSTLAQVALGTSTTAGVNEATMKPYSFLGAAAQGRGVSLVVVFGAVAAVGMMGLL